MAYSMHHDEAVIRYGTAKGYVNACVMIFKSDDYKDANVVAVILPMHLLAGFALELYLKAWLLGKQISSRDVKNFGHDIVSLYEKARELGLPDIEGLEELKNHLAGSHADFTFRYLKQGNEVNTTNWPLAFKIFYDLDCQLDTFLGASAAHGLKPGRPGCGQSS